MRPILMALLFASIIAVQAGAFRRQCYPDTVYITTTADPATRTVTETEIIIATETLTVRPRPITVTAIVTDFATVHDPVITMTETLQGSYLPSSTFAAATTRALPSVTLPVQCSNSLDHSFSLQHNCGFGDTTPLAPAIATVQIVSTVTVVPLATLPPSYLSADRTFSADTPSYPAGTMIPTYPAARNVSTITIARTKTVFMTQTVMLTGLGNSSTATGLFPTMNVTGTMGVKPSSVNGGGGGSAASASVSAGTAGTAGTVSTISIAGPTGTAFTPGTNTAGSANPTESATITTVTGTLIGTMSTAQSVTNATASAGVMGGMASGTATNSLFTVSSQSLPAGNISLSATSGARDTITSSFRASMTSQISSSGQLNGTLKRTELGVGAGTVLASPTDFPRNDSSPTSASRSSVTTAPSSLLPGTMTSQSLGPFANSSASQTVALSASDPTVIRSQSFPTNSIVVQGHSSQVGATDSQPLPTAANVTPSSTLSAFANITATQFLSGASLLTSVPSLSEAVNVTEIQTPSTTNSTAPPKRRCLQEDPFAWRTDGGREETYMTATFPDGKIITQTWNLAQRKRQVGQFITVTIDGQVVSWANNWDGTGTIDLATFSGIPTQLSSPSMDESLAATPTRPSVTSSEAAAPTLTNAQIVVSDVQASSADLQSDPSSRQSWASNTQSIPSSTESFASSDDSTVMLAASEIPTISSSFSQAAPTFGANPTALTPLVSASLSSSTSPTTPHSEPTDVFITYTPPPWLSRLFPPEPTAPPSTATVASIASSPDPVHSLATSTLITASSSWSVPTSATCNGNFVGDFVINFDDLPVVGEPSTNDQYAPLINPYHKIFWSQGYSYVPPPTDPYLPHSGSQLGVFLVNGDANVHSQNWTGPIPQGSDVNGMFGAGKNYQNSHWYIDAKGAWIGCKNTGPGDCDIQVNGFAYDDGIGKSVVQVIQHFYQPPCPSLSNCSLDYFEFSEAFHNLTAVQVQASVQNDPSHTSITWFVDDIALAWSDNSCAAVRARDSAPST